MPSQPLTPALAAELQSAHALWRRGDTGAAQAATRAVIACAPDAAAAHHLAGLIAQSMADLPGALAALGRAHALAPGDAGIHNSLAVAHMDAGDWPRAQSLLQALVARNPGHIDAHLNLALGTAEAGDPNAALAVLQQAASHAPADPRIWTRVGDVQMQIGAPDKAAQAYALALQADPGFARAHHNLGLAEMARFDPGAALTQFEAARRAGLAGPALDRNTALALAAHGQFARAAQCMAAVVDAMPDDVEAQVTLDDYAWQAGQIDRPGAHLLAARRARPDDSLLARATLSRLLQVHNFEAALAVLEHLPPDPDMLAARASALSEAGDLAAATAAFELATPGNANRAGFWCSLARHHLRRRAPDRAEAACQRALALDPDSQLGLSYLSVAWRLQTDPREAWLHDYAAHVHVAALNLGSDRLADLRACLRGLHTATRPPVEQSVRGGTQTLDHLFRRPDASITALRMALEQVIGSWCGSLLRDASHPFLRRVPQPQSGFLFSGAWSVQLAAQGFHVNHIHSQGWISSACYIALPPEVSDGTTTDGWLQLGSPPVELGLDLPPRRLVRPQVGQVVLFPSSMWHGTLPFSSATPRLSVAFDVVPR